MELIVRAYASDGTAADVVVDVETTHRVGELATALGRQLGDGHGTSTITLLRTGTVLDPDATVGDSGIVSGDDVVVGPPYPVQRVPAIPVRAVTLDVLAGRDTGTSLILLQGSFTVGRDPSAQVALTDPTVSRHHLDVAVAADWSVTVTPREDVENVVTRNGEPLEEPTTVGRDDVIGLGATQLAFRPFVRAPGERHDQLGQIEFQRTPYRPPVITERTAKELGRIPTRPDPRRFQVLSVVAPLGAGLTLFAFTEQIQFLALTLMSPLVFVANWFEDRRSGRHRFRRDLEAFRASLDARRAELATLVDDERIERLRAAPDLADLARRAELRTTDLWARGREAPDFLRLRVGLGTAPTLVKAPLDRGGDDDLREEAEAAAEDSVEVAGVPITVDLAEVGVFGVHGSATLVDGVASALVVQSACLHSPEDLTIAAAVSAESPVAAWLKWLPHLRSVTSPLPGRHVADDTAGAEELVARLLEVAEFRMAIPERERTSRRWPWILAVLDGRLEPDPAALADLLEQCPDAGISVVWLAETEADVPRQAAMVLAARQSGTAVNGRLWSTDPEIPDRTIEVEQLRSDIADRVARSLAPIRDASTASLATSIPRTVPLLDVLGVGMPTPEWVTEQWRRRTEGLDFPIGIAADGVLTLDLVADGPHALIGGTSGAGKSELLQSIVASLAVRHAPNRLTFLFVDYKGGAASAVFSELPHTVGYVTNLSAELSRRALTSLRAELNRRMRLLEGKAKDLAEMRQLHPAEAPPSLVIVVDEFATLVKEVPEFVDGIVDIAQRGRSLGIHLILATQRPSGAVNDNILANTNLRICLRMLDKSESVAVINSGEAAEIPVPLKGRGWVRLGPRALVAFQAAYCGSPLVSDDVQAPVLVAPFVRTDDSPKVAAGPATASGTHLDAVLRAIGEANRRLGLAAAPTPWRDVLPELVSLADVLVDPRAEAASDEPGKAVAVGLIDAPDMQDQFPAIIDLEAGSGWLVFGSGGAGKTTLLRTLAVSAIITGGADEVVVVGLDFGSRALASLAPLPQVVDIATGDDLEAVTRHLAVLDAELERRRHLLSAARAENLGSYNQRHDPLPRVLVLVDGFAGFSSTFFGGSSMSSLVPLESWLERFINLVVDGRQVGIHVAMTADRRNAIPSRLHSAVANRLILRAADEMGYTEHGIPLARAKGLVLTPGRGLWQGDSEVQIATVSDDPSSEAQAAAIADLATKVEPPTIALLRSAALPEKLTLDELRPAPPAPLSAPFGVADVSGATVVADLEWSHLAVAGPARSGRTTTLVTCSAGLHADHDVWAVGPASSALDPAWLHHHATGRPELLVPVLEQLANLLDLGASKRPQVLIVDDLDTFDDTSLAACWERLARHDNLRVIAAMETRSLSGYTTNSLLNAMRRTRRLLLLQPDDANDVFQAAGVKSPVRPGQRMVPGRGVYVADRVPIVVQVALP